MRVWGGEWLDERGCVCGGMSGCERVSGWMRRCEKLEEMDRDWRLGVLIHGCISEWVGG